MMTTTIMLKARASALPAIAAALALSSTIGLAQEVSPQPPPATTATTPTTTATPATTVDAPPVTTDSSATVAAPDSSTTTTTRRAVTHTTHVAAARPAPAPRRTVATRTTTHAAAPVQTPSAAAPTPAAPAPAASTSHVAPVVDLNAKSAATSTTATAAPTHKTNVTPLVLGAGALALLVIGGGVYALTRRRHEEEEWVDEPAMEHEPVETAEAAAVEPAIHHEEPAMIAPSAFAWGSSEPKPPEQNTGRDADDDRLPGESWIERAYRGPSPGNPSVSLKNRLRRAAFFDKRERDVAAGVAQPVDMDAGLPDGMVEEQEREIA